MRKSIFLLFAVSLCFFACNNSTTTNASEKDSTKLKDSVIKKDTSNQDSLSAHPAQNAPY